LKEERTIALRISELGFLEREDILGLFRQVTLENIR